MPQIRQKGQRVEGSHSHRNSMGCRVWGENEVKVRGGIARLDRVQERPAFTACSETEHKGHQVSKTPASGQYTSISLKNSKFSSVAQSCLTLCDPRDCSLPRLPCPSLTLRACSNSYPLSLQCHPTISSSVIPFFSSLQSFPASGSFPMSQFSSGG